MRHLKQRDVIALLVIILALGVLWLDFQTGLWQEIVILSGIVAGLMTFVMTATTGLPLGASFTNTVEISGSVLGPFTRTATVSQHLPLWLPLILRP